MLSWFKARKIAVLSLLGLVALIVAATLWYQFGSQSSPQSNAQHQHQAQSEQMYTCSMHPQVRQEEPGQCPICGMDLVPVSESKTKTEKNPHVVRIDPVMSQNMGVRTQKLSEGKVVRKIRTVGQIEVAEDEISAINLRFSGWIEKIWADQTEQKVEKGDPLFKIYSPEVVSAQQEYLLAVRRKGKDSKLAQSARKRLSQWDIPQRHLDRILKTGNGQLRLIVRAPREGYILQKNVILGNKVRSGVDLYRIGNLEKIWVKADVYEHDAPWVEVGQDAQMELQFAAGRRWEGKVSYIYPRLDPKTRTLKIRLEFENQSLNLKPGMFATVYIDSRVKEDILTVPNEAIIRTGRRQLVFVQRDKGKFEPREIVTGLVGDNGVSEVKEGLKKGEKIVLSGQFLLDSESQFREATRKMQEKGLQKNE